MIKSFEKWGWSVKIVGVDSGGRVESFQLQRMKNTDRKN